nr:sodium:solute symporter family protein [uncultured Oscillibacter sp.]
MVFQHYVGALLVLLMITAVGIYSGKKVTNAADFSTGGRSAGAGIVAGSLIGTLVGGASTIGTAQLAFNYGFSAWWFTMGGGIGLIVMALSFAKPLYRSGTSTIAQIFEREYGRKVAITAALLMSIGTFLSITSQLLSGISLITSVSEISSPAAVSLIVFLMLVYVVFGGVWGAGMVGIVKTILLYLAAVSCGIVSLQLSGGWTTLRTVLPESTYFNLFARGLWKDGGACLSLIFGVLTTQSYIQAIVSAKSLKDAQLGAVAAGVLTPAIGIAGIFVGMYMRMAEPGLSPVAAMPVFILRHLPPLWGGIILAALLAALIGTGAGLALGMSSMLCGDIIKPRCKTPLSDAAFLRVQRLIIVAILASAGLFTFGNMGSVILSWSFMSMGLRGAVAFAPLLFCLYAPGRADRRFVLSAIIAGPLVVLAGNFVLPSEIDPLFPGISVGLLLAAAGAVSSPKDSMKWKN